MYTLYFLPDACSLAIHTLLIELDQPVSLVHRDDEPDYHRLNPVGAVPALRFGSTVLTEGAAIGLYLLQAHPSRLWPDTAPAQNQVVQDLLFANATLHPAYSRLFWLNAHIKDTTARNSALQQAASDLSRLWQLVESRLVAQPFLAGREPGLADILLAVYARWDSNFSVTIERGKRTRQLIASLHQRPAFQRALAQQNAYQQTPAAACGIA